jgi:hypothetical protein
MHEYALEEGNLDNGRRHIVLDRWSEDIEEARNSMRRFVEVDEVYVAYGGFRHHRYRIVTRPKVQQYEIVEEES